MMSLLGGEIEQSLAAHTPFRMTGFSTRAPIGNSGQPIAAVWPIAVGFQ
jgi:hypothetical protein